MSKFDNDFYNRFKPWAQLIGKTEQKYGLPSGLLAATAWQESKFNPKAFNSSANDSGMFQFIPGTARMYGLKDPFDPYAATDAAGRYYRDLLKQFDGKVDRAVAAYNSGSGNVQKRINAAGEFVPNAKQQEYMGYVLPVIPHGAKALTGGRVEPETEPGPVERFITDFGGPVLNALIPAAQAGESEIHPDLVKWDDEPAKAESIKAEHVEWDDEPRRESGNTIESWYQRNKPVVDQGLRMTARTLAAPVVGPLDLANDAFAGVVNNVVPGAIETQPLKKRLDYMMRKAGINPESAGTVEDVLQAFGSAGFGASAINKVLPYLQSLEKGRELSQGATMGRAMVQQMSGDPALQAMGAGGASLGSNVIGGAVESVKPEYGPAGRIAGGVLGGLAGSASYGVGSGVASMAGRATQPFTQSGKEKIAGRILNKNASAPMAGADRDEMFNRQIVEGSQPTLAEVRQDPGLARLQRVLPSTQAGLEAGVGDLNNIRMSQMDRAIDQMMAKVNKQGPKGDWLEAVRPLQDRIYSTFQQTMKDQKVDLNNQPVDISGTMGELQRLSVSKVGKSAVEDLINKVGSSLVKEGPEGTHPQGFQKVWNTRQDLDRLLYEKLLTADKGSKKELKDVGEQIRAAMNRDLVGTVPEFGEFLQRYARVTRAGGRMNLGRELYGKTLNTARNIADDQQEAGGRQVSGAKMENLNLDKEQARAGVQLSPYQREAFDLAKREKARGNILINGGAPGNSATAQNMAMDNIIARDIAAGLAGDRMGKGGFLADTLRNVGTTMPGRLVQMAATGSQNDIMRMVAQGLIDPVEGARLMKLGQLRPNVNFGDSLNALARPGVLSEMFRNLSR